MMFFVFAVCALTTVASFHLLDARNENLLYQQHKRAYFIIEDRINKSIPPLDISQTEVDGMHRFPCFIRVGAFKNQNSTEPVSDAEVTVLTRKINESNDYAYYGYGNNYVGFTRTTTGIDGMACAPTLCFHEALIFVVKEGERMTLASNETEFLPRGYFYIAQTRSEEVAFAPRYMGTMYGKRGPVYREMNKNECERSVTSSSWYFRFVYLSVPEHLNAVEKESNLPMSWYPYSSKTPNFAVCFMKLTIYTNQNNTIVNATSYDSLNRTYGYFISGPKANPDSPDTSVRAACIEYRCPVNEAVLVDVKISSPECIYNERPTSPTNPLRLTINHTDRNFSVLLQPGDRYGPADGIYVANGVESARTIARNWCTAGSSYYESGFSANPSKQPLASYNCITAPAIIG